jgi:DNA-binding IclR family transcriptional regulator
VETSQPLRLSVQPGRQLPLHAGASQKALLAFMAEPDVERVVSAPLEVLCRATITDPGALREELKRIRERGWASSYEETNLGVWGVAVPVLADRDAVTCAVGIAGPNARLETARVREDVRRVHAAASEIALALGVSVPAISARRADVRMRRGGPAR